MNFHGFFLCAKVKDGVLCAVGVFFIHFLADLIFYAYLWLKETLKPNAMIASILIFIVSWLIVGGLIIGMLYWILWFLWRVFYDDPKNDRHTHFFRPF